MSSINPNSSNIPNFSHIFKKFKYPIIIICIIFIILIIYYIYHKANQTINKSKKVLYEPIITSNLPMAIPDCEVSPPINGTDFSCSFWLFINKFYDNHLFWKHLFHKGSPILNKETELKFEDWEVLVSEYPQQTPGLWIDPNTNILRLSFSTEITKNYPETSHAHNTTDLPSTGDLQTNELIKATEFCDLNNIPVNEYVHISFVVNKDTIDIYQNSKQIKTCSLKGIPQFNKGAFFFSYQRSYNGHMRNFNYYPYKLKSTDIQKEFNNKPKPIGINK